MDVVSLRRFFHQHAEVGFTEFLTTSKIIDVLRSLDYKVIYGKDIMEAEKRRGMPSEWQIEQAYCRAATADWIEPSVLEAMKGGYTGVVGILEGTCPGPIVAFRFDIDALPVKESEDPDHLPQTLGFRSVHEGNMHACGHDAHVAIGLSFAERMASRNFCGVLKLIFQPAEEGVRGAYPMVAKGILDDVDKLFCLHLGLGAPLGYVYGGSANWLNVTKYSAQYYGIAAHSGQSPELGRNSLLGAATSLLNIHAISRFGSSDTRINVGLMEGGTAANIVPSYAKMLLETRASSEEVNRELERRVRNILKHSADMHDLNCEIEIMGRAFSIQCDEELVRLVMETARDIAGVNYVHDFYQASAAEDACYMTEHVQKRGGQATYMIIGTDIAAAHHNERFDIDEAALPIAVDLLSQVAARTLTERC
jgi:aminobenzoyl-glutamate utilization protein A